MFRGLPVSFAEFFAFIVSLLSSVPKQSILFINIHSHFPAGPHEWAVQNHYQHFEQVAVPGNYSIGLHPWYLNEETIIADIEELKKWSVQANVLAIGECGLDRVCSTDFLLQKDIFLKQVQWANELHKPLIIHCVKAHEDVLQLLLKHQNKVPVIFHGYNKSKELALKIISSGYYISFGKDLQHERIRKVMAELSGEKIFLETDDSETGIEKIYTLAAEALQITEDSLSLQLQKNAAAVFGVAAIKL